MKRAEKPPRVELNRINLEPYNFNEMRYTTKSTQTTFEVIPVIKPPLLQDVQQELGMLNRTLTSIGETIEVQKKASKDDSLAVKDVRKELASLYKSINSINDAIDSRDAKPLMRLDDESRAQGRSSVVVTEQSMETYTYSDTAS